MVDVKELRIGNLVDSLDGITPVIEIDGYNDRVAIYDEKYNDRSGYLISSIKPIPLTKEWLVKFGFEVNWMSGSVLAQLKINDKLRLVRPYSENILGELEFDLHYDCISLNTCAVKYVHTLQNLYFALTGEELIYTP